MAWKIEAAARTDIGLVRRTNQDSFGVDETLGLYLVCDGMGGAAGGEVASALAVETFLAIARQELACRSCDPAELTPRSLRRAVAAANQAVLERARWDTALRGMGSTLVAVRVDAGHATVVHVGDSRAYLIRNGAVTPLTEDHSYVAERIRLGLLAPEDAAGSPMRSVITRAIGADADVQPDLASLPLQPGDLLLLTSDGLTRHLKDTGIAALLTTSPDTQTACDTLIQTAKQRGGSDNITCVLLRVH